MGREPLLPSILLCPHRKKKKRTTNIYKDCTGTTVCLSRCLGPELWSMLWSTHALVLPVAKICWKVLALIQRSSETAKVKSILLNLSRPWQKGLSAVWPDEGSGAEFNSSFKHLNVGVCTCLCEISICTFFL